MSKRIGALFLGLILAFSLTGCNQSDIIPPDTEVEVTDDMNISFLTNFGFSKGNDTLLDWNNKFLEETGYTIQVDNLTGNEYYQMLDYTLAMGKANDIVAISEGKLPSYVVDEALLDITDFVNESEILSTIPEEYMEAGKVNDRIYGIPVEFGGGTVTYVRQDILDELGIAVPTTFEEFISMLEQIKAAYPEMIPYTAPGLVGNNADYYLADFYQDASPEIIKVNDKWVDGMLEENMKPALERLRNAYAKGLIDPEIAHNSTSVARTKFMEGKAAVFNYWAGQWNMTFQQKLAVNIGEHAIAAPIKAIKGVPYRIRPAVVMAITKNADCPESIVKNVFEYMHDNGQGSMLFQHGVEGIHYKLEGNKIVHQVVGDGVFTRAYITPSMAFEELEQYEYEENKDIQNSLNILKECGVQQYNLPASEMYTSISNELTDIKKQIISDIMLGVLGIDEGIASYEATAKELGIEQVLQEMNS